MEGVVLADPQCQMLVPEAMTSHTQELEKVGGNHQGRVRIRCSVLSPHISTGQMQAGNSRIDGKVNPAEISNWK